MSKHEGNTGYYGTGARVELFLEGEWRRGTIEDRRAYMATVKLDGEQHTREYDIGEVKFRPVPAVGR